MALSHARQPRLISASSGLRGGFPALEIAPVSSNSHARRVSREYSAASESLIAITLSSAPVQRDHITPRQSFQIIAVPVHHGCALL
jgi:hypothetical protein